MTMHIYFKKDKDGYKNGWSGYVERTLARRFCENDIAIPYQKHLDAVYDAEQALEKAKTEMLKKKETTTVKKTVSRRPARAEKAVKK